MLVLYGVVGNRRRCGPNIREKNRIRKWNRKKGQGVLNFVGKVPTSHRLSLASASQKSLFMKETQLSFLASRMNVWCIYTHGLMPCALLCCVGIGLYINTFPRHGYSMTFLFPSWTTSAAQTPLHLFGFPLLFLNLPFLLLFVCVLYYFHCGQTGRRPYALRYPVSLPSTPFISVPFLPFRYFSSNSKGKRNRQFSFVLRRSHEKEEEEARDMVDTLGEGAGVFFISTKYFCQSFPSSGAHSSS